jgi:hypothetical protein
MIFGTRATGGTGTTTDRWQLSTAGHLQTVTGQTLDIGEATQANSPRTVYAATSVVVGTTVTITGAAIDASAALTLGGTTATSLTLGRAAVGVSAPSWLNVGTATLAVAQGDFSAGLTGAGNSQLTFDQSAKTLTVLPGTASDGAQIQIGATSDRGTILLTATPGADEAIISAANGTGSANGAALVLKSGAGDGDANAGDIRLEGASGGGSSSNGRNGGDVHIDGGDSPRFGASNPTITGCSLTVQGGNAGSSNPASGGSFVVVCGNHDKADLTGLIHGGDVRMDAGNNPVLGGMVRLRAGDATTGVGGELTMLAGNATAAGGTHGSVLIDCGTGAGTILGTMSLGTTNAGTVTIGRAGQTVSMPGTLAVGTTTTITTNSVTFSAAGTIQSTGANAITIDSGTTGTINIGVDATNAKTLNLDSGTTGALNIGTSAFAKTITIGDGTATTTEIELNATLLDYNAGTGGHAFTGNMGFFGTTPVAQQANIVSLTDSTGGTANDTVAAVSGTGDDAGINDGLADLIAKVNGILTILGNLGLMA